jgi:hypothetical protein
LGRRDLTGTVQKIDHASGELTLGTETTTLTLPFPADALTEVDNGDRVMVRSAFTLNR